MKLNRFFYAILFISFLMAGPAFAANNALRVLSATPKGAQENLGRRAVQVHFNQAVVPLSEAAELSSQDCPLSITPSVKGTCRFSGTQTLVFEPLENWPLATRFTATLKAGFTSKVSKQKLAKNYRFVFSSDVPRVTQVLPFKEEHWLSLTPTVFVQFSQPVDVTKINSFVTLSSASGTVKTAARVAEEAEITKNFPYTSNKNIVALSPLSKLQKGEKYTLTLAAGLPAKNGNLGLEKEYKTSFYTYPDFDVKNTQNAGCLPFTPTIDFATPVRLGELYRFAEVIPASAKQELTEQEKNQLGYERTDRQTQDAFFRTPLSFVKMEAEQKVQVVLKAGMQDIYGNTLKDEVTINLSNNGYCPTVDFSGGKGVLESYLKPYLPISLMNITSLPIRGTRFNKNNFIPFDQTDISYCKEAPLKDPFLNENYSFKEVKNHTYNTFLDLAKFKPTAQDSIVFSQIQVTRGEGEKPCWISSTDNITDVGVTFKTSPENILLWATSLKTGAPLAGYEVELRDKNNRVLWNGQTDSFGLARAAGWNKLNVDSPRWGLPEIYAFVTSPNGDAVVSSLWNDGMELWRFNIDYSYSPQRQLLRSYIFTDRGIYRPNETVFVKGILRTLQNSKWILPDASVTGEVSVMDSRGEEVFSKKITLSSDFGSFDFSVPLKKSAPTGNWTILFEPLINGQKKEDVYTSAYFQVEDVKPAEFKVNLRSAQENYMMGEEARFYLSAAYQFGGPLAGAPAKWTLRQAFTTVEPKGYKEYEFAPYFLRGENWYSENKIVTSATDQLDSKGSLTFTAKMPTETLPRVIYAEASVQSPSRQDLFSRTSVTLHPSDYYIGTKVETENPEAGKPVAVRVVAVTPDGKPVDATVTAEIYKEQWFSVRKVGLAGRLEWVNEKKTTSFPSQTLAVSKKGSTLYFTPQEGGSYFIKLRGTDLLGRTVIGGADFFAYGEGENYWKKSDDDLIKLTANKNEYKVGQTARIAVASPYAKTRALVTVESEGILDAWITELKGGSDFIPVKIKENYLPNVYVGVVLVQGRTDKPITEKLDLGKPQVKAGYVNLKVIPDGKKLETTVKTNREKYQPGQTVTVDITTKAAGKAVPAEVTVMAVDEGILDLTHYKLPDLFNRFYGSRPLSVFTMDNRAFLIGQRSFGEKGENRGGGGSAAAVLGGTDLRSNFKFTPFFKANVHTDHKGRATTSFTLPDNLTSFRVMAVSAAVDSFGEAETSIKVAKPLMITPNLPRFVRQGDSFSCSAVVHNYEDKKGDLTVEAVAEGLTLLSSSKTFNLPMGQTREVSWPCQADKLGTATVSFVVRGSKDMQDGVRQTFEVVTVEKPQQLSANGFTQTAKTEYLDEPANLRAEGNNRVTAVLSSTALVQIKSAIRYLLVYPYDCLEQQFSKIMPLVTGQKLAEDFGLITAQNAREMVQGVLDNLPAYQSPNGGFAYWKKDAPDPYVTAYVLEGAYLAKQAGYQVPQESLKQAAQWLAQAFNPQGERAFYYSSRETETMQAYSAYVRALYGQNTQGDFNTLYMKRNTLSSSALSYLILASHTLKQPDAVKNILAQQLLNKVVYNPTTAYVDEAEDELVYLHAGDVSATALMLTAFLQTGIPLDNAPQFAGWLISQLNAQGTWKNTADNALAVRALSAYYGKFEKENPQFTATVTQAPDHALVTHHFEGRLAVGEQYTWPFTQIYQNSTEAQFTFAKQGAGTLYYTLGQVYEPKSFTKPIQAGFSVTRTIADMNGTPVTQMEAGQRYNITLKVVSSMGRPFVVLEDFIPAGFDLVNTALATESAYSSSADNNVFTRTEQYKDHIAAFASYVPAGTHTFTYQVAATVRGTFAYPSAWVSQMYEPEVFGRNATTEMVIK